MEGGRLDNGLQLYGSRTAPGREDLTASPVKGLDQGREFRKFHADCAAFGSRDAIACALGFFGPDHLVFASDMPFDPEDGFGYVRRTLADIDALVLPEEEKDKLRWKNAAELLRL